MSFPCTIFWCILAFSQFIFQGCHSSEIEKFPDFSLTFKQFSLTLHSWAFFAGHQYFHFIFNQFPPFVERGRRNLEESIYNKNHWSQPLHVSGVVSYSLLCLLYSIRFIFSKRKCLWSLEENLQTINRKTEFPDFDNIKDFFLTLKKISLSFPDYSGTVSTNFLFSEYDQWLCLLLQN